MSQDSNSSVVDIIQTVVGELKEMARSESIVGQPITVGDRTVIPVIKVAVGFGVGGGQGEKVRDTGSMHMGGGGGGVSMGPAAFIIIDEEGISLLPATKTSWDGLIEAIPSVAAKLASLRDKRPPDSE